MDPPRPPRRRRRSSLILEASAEGVSKVFTSEDGVDLLLGSAANGLAAASCAIPNVVSIVCVAKTRNARAIAASPRVTSGEVAFKRFSMNDWLRPDDIIDLDVAARGPLEALDQAFAAATAAITAAGGGGKAAVLVHCDLGHNRGPTLALAFLVRRGFSLRRAYKLVLRARPAVDPLPPYREALRALEARARLKRGQAPRQCSARQRFARALSHIGAESGGHRPAQTLDSSDQISAPL